MSMTTPRVTVPVDGEEVTITLTGKVSDTMPDRPGWFRVTGHKFIFSATGDDAAIHLSAAPAPEGGAVDTVWRCAMTVACNIAIDEQNRTNDDDGPSEVLNAQGEIIRRLKGVLEIDRNYRSEVEAILRHGAEPFITAPSSEAALATREEAPAEAGELRRAIKCLTYELDRVHPNHKTMFVYVADLRVVLSALRAQPQAREEAQPVALTVAEKLALKDLALSGGETWLSKTQQSALDKVVAGLTTPPAPEAEKLLAVVRAAKEVCLAAATERFERLHCHPAVEALEEALAALQQEGRE